MNFQAMNKQRKFILLASVIGILAMFLPWVDILFENFNGMHGKAIIILFCFITNGIIAVKGNRQLNLDKISLAITLTSSFVALLALIIFYFKADMGVTYGYYIALLAAIAVILAAWIFRKHEV